MPKKVMTAIGIYCLSATLGWALVGVAIGMVLD